MKHNKKLAFLLALTFLLSAAFLIPEVKGSDGWLEGYSYRKRHTINNVNEAECQVTVTAYYRYDLDFGGNLFVAEKCRGDFADINFTADDGLTLLKHRQLEINYYNNASFMIELSEPVNGSTSLYVYYGNPDDSAVGANTFIRKVVVPEPTHGSWGPTETMSSNSLQADTPVDNSSSNPDDLIFALVIITVSLIIFFVYALGKKPKHLR